MKTLTKRVDAAQSINVGDHRRTAAATNLPDQTEESQTSHTADHVVVNYEGPEHVPRTNDHEVAQTE